jgi:outer membrane protein
VRQIVTVSVAMLVAMLTMYSVAQEREQPSPFTVPASPTPGVRQSPGQSPVPMTQPMPVAPDAPLPKPDQTTVDLRNLKPLSQQPLSTDTISPALQHAADANTKPNAETPAPFDTHVLGLIGPYRATHVPALPAGSANRFDGLIRDGKLYLSLHDAIALALENNLDVEVSRYNLLAADTDVTRAKGGGTLRGLDYTIQQTADGVGSLTSPLLVTASTTGSSGSTNAQVTDLSQITQSGSGQQQNLSQNSTHSFSTGPAVPLYDPTLVAEAGYFRRSDQTSLISTGGATPTAPLDFVSVGTDFQEGFSPGTQIDAYVDNAAQALYASNSQYNPFHAPSTSVTVTQPLLRGRGRGINLRFIRIAQIDQRVSRLLFEQQVLETVYGVSRLYYDLVSLGENIGVKQEALAAAQKLYDDDRNQESQGTLAPVEVMRAQALLSSSRLDLIQAEGEYRQQEVILKEQLLRRVGDPAVRVERIVATDKISVPDEPPAFDVPALIHDALENRPDLAQAGLQVKADEVATKGSKNNVKPQLNIYANVQTRGSSLVPYGTTGSPGTGEITVPTAITQGGLRLSTIYQGGLQLNLPLRNRIAQSDYVRDTIQLRQAESRTVKLENDIRQQIENACIALENAHQAYAAAVESRNYQQQLLQAELDKFSVGASTNFLIVQDEAYLAQARSTEVAARSDWMKAQISLDRALGNLLDKNNIALDDAVSGHMQ